MKIHEFSESFQYFIKAWGEVMAKHHKLDSPPPFRLRRPMVAKLYKAGALKDASISLAFDIGLYAQEDEYPDVPTYIIDFLEKRDASELSREESAMLSAYRFGQEPWRIKSWRDLPLGVVMMLEASSYTDEEIQQFMKATSITLLDGSFTPNLFEAFSSVVRPFQSVALAELSGFVYRGGLRDLYPYLQAWSLTHGVQHLLVKWEWEHPLFTDNAYECYVSYI